MSKLSQMAWDVLNHLPQKPWRNFGNSIYAGNNLVLEAPGGEGEKLAREVAKIPDLLHLLAGASPDVLLSRIEGLEQQVAELEEALALLQKKHDAYKGLVAETFTNH